MRGQVPGVSLDLADLARNREPASLDEALDLYLPLLLPERDVSSAVERLRTIIHDPELAQKIADSAPSDTQGDMVAGMDDDSWDVMAGPNAGSRRARRDRPMPQTEVDHSPVARVSRLRNTLICWH